MHPHRKRILRFFLHRWHRRIGISAALLVLISATSGIALNHTGMLGLSSQFPQSSILLSPYRAALPPVYGYQLKDSLLHVENEQLVLAGEPLMDCMRLTGVADFDFGLVVACESQWFVFDQDNNFIEVLDPALLGLSGSEPMGVSKGFPAVKTRSGWVTIDLDNLTLTEAGTGQVSELIRLASANQSISWQRILLDIHSGRWLGSWGVWLMDIAALMLILLSLSGMWVWWSKQRSRR